MSFPSRLLLSMGLGLLSASALAACPGSVAATPQPVACAPLPTPAASCAPVATPAACIAAPAPVPIALPVTPTPVWNVSRGKELHDVLYDWTRQAGWTLVWKSEYSYQLDANAHFEGSLTDAVTQLFRALGELNPPLYPQLYQGNRVLVVTNQPAQ